MQEMLTVAKIIDDNMINMLLFIFILRLNAAIARVTHSNVEEIILNKYRFDVMLKFILCKLVITMQLTNIRPIFAVINSWFSRVSIAGNLDDGGIDFFSLYFWVIRFVVCNNAIVRFAVKDVAISVCALKAVSYVFVVTTIIA